MNNLNKVKLKKEIIYWKNTCVWQVVLLQKCDTVEGKLNLVTINNCLRN